MSDTPKTIPQLHAEAERLRLEIEIIELTAQRDMYLRAKKAEEVRLEMLSPSKAQDWDKAIQASATIYGAEGRS